MSRLSLFTDDKTSYIENPKESDKNLLGLVNPFGEAVGYNGDDVSIHEQQTTKQ